jgi:hypothetical protein
MAGVGAAERSTENAGFVLKLDPHNPKPQLMSILMYQQSGAKKEQHTWKILPTNIFFYSIPNEHLTE